MKMTDVAYGYYELKLFDGAIVLPLKFCTSYPGEDKLRANAPTKTGVDGRPTNRIYVLPKKGVKKINKVDDVDRIIEWNAWETYLNTGTVTMPVLEPICNYSGLQEILDEDKNKSKCREITVHGFHNMNLLRPYHYTGRNFHCYILVRIILF